jgi:hypothetical protein
MKHINVTATVKTSRRRAQSEVERGLVQDQLPGRVLT